MNWKVLWDAIKLPLRIAIFTAFSAAITYLISYITELPNKSTFEAILIPALSALLAILDKYKHEVNKLEAGKKKLEGFDRGLVPF